MRVSVLIALMAFGLTGCLAYNLRDSNADYVPQMPNWSLPVGYDIYSGYLTFNSEYDGVERNFHYFFLAKDPTDRLILWLNGGPGCSSLDGLLTEIGPYIFAPGQDYYNGTYNENTWLNEGSLLFLESPAGVGFSYEASNSSGWSESQTASDNYQALLQFFIKYPSYSSSEFWISGESYAGMYLPYLADYIDSNLTTNYINLKGLMVGNPYVGVDNTYWETNFYVTHDLGGPVYKGEFEKSCSATNINSISCQSAIDDIQNANIYINPYGIYDYCYYADQIPSVPTTSTASGFYERYKKTGFVFSDRKPGQSLEDKINEKMPEVVNPDDVSILPCTDSLGETLYLRNSTVISAMHVEEANGPWNVCSYEVLEGYDKNLPAATSLYQDLAEKYSVLVFVGDQDSVCNWQYNNYWINTINEEDGGWRQWYTSSGQVGGFVEDGTKSGMTYATVRGATHMVPASEGAAILELIDRFMNGETI